MKRYVDERGKEKWKEREREIGDQGLISPACLSEAFAHADCKSAKNTVKPSVFFCAFGIWAGKKLCVKNW
jgi:hypothetical protein